MMVTKHEQDIHRAAAKSSSSGRFFTTACFRASSISRFAFSVISIFLSRLLHSVSHNQGSHQSDSLHAEVDFRDTR